MQWTETWLVGLALASLCAVTAHAADFQILVFSKTAGYRHASIEKGVETLRELGEANGFAVDATEDASAFTDENLANYDAVVFLSTTGRVLDEDQKAAFERYIQAGNGFVGVHSASDTHYEWEWYGQLVGAYFSAHPRQQEARVIVEDREHISTAHLGDEFTLLDEWYDFQRNPREDVNVLLALDEESYAPREPMGDHPITWCREYDGGRSWYTALGHREDVYDNWKFRQLLLGGVIYAATGATTHEDDAGRAVRQAAFEHVIVDAENPANPHCKTVGDINGNGHVDLLAAGASANAGAYWYSYPDWEKHRIADGAFTTDMTVGDIDGSGHLDVVIPRRDMLMWFRNPASTDGDPARDQWEAHEIGREGARMHDVRIADLNGNGRLDIVGRHQSGFGHERGNAIHLWFQGDDPHSWTHHQFETPHGEGVAVADLNGNGRPDVIIGARWYENPGEGMDREPWPEHKYISDDDFEAGWRNGDTVVAVGDISGNGRMDIVVSPAEGRGHLAWFAAPEDPRRPEWTRHDIQRTDHMHALALGDMNGNGRLDIVAAKMHQASDPQEVSIFYNAGAGQAWVQQVLSTNGSHSIQVFAFGDTGRLAVYGANWNDNSPTGGALELWRPVDEQNRN